MKKIASIEGIAAPMPREDIDTDAMIPQEWLITTDRKGLGRGLYANWRYGDDGLQPRLHFVLNQPRYAGARIIVAGTNYGCGSSREHAVWAHQDFGIEAVIAPSFGPIFRDNALRNGLLAITLDAEVVAHLIDQLEQAEKPAMQVDLEACIVSGPEGEEHSFAIDPAIRDALLQGRDAIAATLDHRDAIMAFHAQDRVRHPFLWPD